MKSSWELQRFLSALSVCTSVRFYYPTKEAKDGWYDYRDFFLMYKNYKITSMDNS